MTRKAARGFTLIEVLIALVVLALALGAVIKVAGQSGDVLGQLRGDTAAAVVAEDLCSRLRLAQEIPDRGTRTSKVRIDGHDWQVTREVVAGAFPDVLEVTFRVRAPSSVDGRAQITTYLYAGKSATATSTSRSNVSANATASGATGAQ